MSSPPRPLTSSTVPPILQSISRIDSAENPEIMSENENSRPKKAFKVPLLRFRVNDVCSEGASTVFATVNVEKMMREAVLGVLDALYTPDTAPKNVRSVTLILRSMDGVAYTTGSDLDSDHKEIHFSTDYIAGVHERSGGRQDEQEILGVVRHEMVHCFQFNAKGTCNGGLIEGIADWVRYKAGFIPPHWHIGSGNKWDDGYQNTAYFLLWLEQRFGPATVPKINEWLRDSHYSEKLWVDLFAEKPESLWKKYRRSVGGDGTSRVRIPIGSGPSTPAPPNDVADDASMKTESYVEVSPSSTEPDSKSNDRTVSFFQISEMRLIARDRLCKLTYNGTGSLKRFFNSFESLIEVLDPNMPEKEKKLLLVTALSGKAAALLDDLDSEDRKSYTEIKTLFMENNV